MGALDIRVAGVVVVVHAGIERRAGRALVVEPERVPDLLAHHVLTLGRVVVLIGRARPEVVFVPLDRALDDVRRARLEPDGGDPEPAVVSITRVADLVPPG